MRRNVYRFHIGDFRDGTRALSDRAFRVYTDLLLALAEAGGRLAFATPAEKVELVKRLGYDRRKFWAGLAELTASRKLHVIEGWIVNARVLREVDALREAVEQWGWSIDTLVGIGIDRWRIEAALRDPQRPVENGDSRPAATRRAAPQEARSAGLPADFPDTSAGLPAERDIESEQNQRLARAALYLLPTTHNDSDIEPSYLQPRAREPADRPRMRLGEGGAGPPVRRSTRRESAEAKLLAALIADNREPEAAMALLERASDPASPGHDGAAATCARVSYRVKAGWYAPKTIN